MRLRTLVIRFENKLNSSELPFFRGAIISAVGGSCSILFHNHNNEGYRYSYPLIQYKRIGMCAAIVCVGDGVEQIGELFMRSDLDLRIDNRRETFAVSRIEPSNIHVQLWQTQFSYHLRGWLPFSSKNYLLYQQIDGVCQRTAFLEKILIGNMLSFCKGIGYTVDDTISCCITQLGEAKVVRFKGIMVTSFDLVFKTNLSLPDYIGLGHGVSMGHGIVVSVKEKKQ